MITRRARRLTVIITLVTLAAITSAAAGDYIGGKRGPGTRGFTPISYSGGGGFNHYM